MNFHFSGSAIMSDADKKTKVVALITKARPSSAAHLEALKVSFVRLMTAGGQSPGFWSGEIIHPSDAADTEWKLVLRFKDSQSADCWKESPERKEILQSIAAETQNQVKVEDELTQADGQHGTVSTSIVTEIKPGMEKEYFDWQSKIQIAQTKYPGYRGVYWQPPSPGFPQKWAILLRFDSPENLENWLNSEERLQLVAEQDDLVKTFKIQRMVSPYPGWFPVDEQTGKPTPKWKTLMLLVVALFPVILLEAKFITPLLKGVNTPIVMFVNLTGSVASSTWISMPILVNIFKWWITPGKNPGKANDLKGIALIVLIYAAELALFWHILPARQ
jgi:antibiotic biosynthesis monooxygenase (ABM) superfamily enzyme